MTVIVTSVGYPGAGKSVVAAWMEESGVPVVSMGDQLRDRFQDQDKDKLKKDLGVSNASSLLGKWATQQRDKYGPDVVAKWTSEYIEDYVDSDIVFVDGLRSNKERTLFEDRFTSVYIILVEASREIRLERIKNRGREGESDFTAQDLEQRDSREEEWGLSEVVQSVDYEIENEYSMKHFQSRISEVFTDIQQEV